MTRKKYIYMGQAGSKGPLPYLEVRASSVLGPLHWHAAPHGKN